MNCNTESQTYHHVPVLSDEVLKYLQCEHGKTYIDCTLGGAGHAKRIEQVIAPDGQLIAIDQDIEAIHNAQTTLSKKTIIVHGNFKNVRDILDQLGIDAVDGIIADLGISLFHIKQSGRGFSFMKSEPLDMRMNPQTKTTATDILATLSEKALADLFWRYGEERFSRQVAKKIVRIRSINPIESTTHLCNIIKETIPIQVQKRMHIHPATRIFMALRMAVNTELDCISVFLENVLSCLNPGGRLCMISFHSLEDRLIKHCMRKWEKPCTCPKDLPECVCNQVSRGVCIKRKGILATPDEIKQNPMARSARLRIFEKNRHPSFTS
jgi:16S rRNA (cytosine1402-N4)-methyltransferase